MSTIGEVIHDTSAFVDAFDELLKTKTAREAPAIAADLGARPQFEAAMGKASNLVGSASDWVGRARRVATVADAAIAVFGMLPHIADGAAKAASAIQTVNAQADIGLDTAELNIVVDRMQYAVTQVRTELQLGVDVAETALAFIDPPALGLLQVSLHRLQADIAAFGAAKSQTPATATATA